jgi:hypothetical protein
MSGPYLAPMTRFALLSDICGLHVVECPRWREDGSVIYSYNLLSLSGPSPAELVTTSYCLTWDCPNQESQVPVFISPRNRVAQLYPQALGSLFVTSYGSQGYNGGILTRLHTGLWLNFNLRPTVSWPVRLGVRRHLEQVTRFYISLIDNYFLSSSYRAPSLTRGLVCNLQCNHASSSSSHIATDGQSASSPVCLDVVFFFMYGALTHIPMNRVILPKVKVKNQGTLTKTKSKLCYDWRSVSQYVLVSSPLWNLWPDITFCLKVAVLSLWGALSDEKSGLPLVSHCQQYLVHCQNLI